uniref:autotransporter outer membrane beta-barrel domain-containing protein n=1 Tax=Pseudomonas sp. 95_A TaxID=2813570 RepID=UPI001A9F7D12
LAGKVNNAGSLDLGIERNSDNRLTIEGDYSGDNGNLVLNSVLEGDNGTADRLIVNGDTAGHTWVSINNLGGQGALTDKGIAIVTVKGDSAGTFAKSGRIVAGAYDYDVVKKDSNWFLASEKAYRPEFGSYLANARAANTLFHTRLHDRLGETQYTDRLTGEQKVTSLWMRHIGGHNRFRDASGKLHT